MPDKQIFFKSIISEGVSDVRLDRELVNLNQELIKVKQKVKLAQQQTQLNELNSYLAKLEQKKRARDSEFLFLASTLGAPRNIVSQLPNYQGHEKIVKFRFEEDGLKVYQVEEDIRFTDNPLNEKPILSVPLEYLDFKCATNAQGDCTNKEVLDDEKDWTQKRYFSPDFDRTTITHLSELKIWVEDGCFTQVSQKSLNAQLTKDVLNIEIEREYELKNEIGCLIQHFDFKSFTVQNPSFKVRYFYSIVRLNQLTSKNYQAIEYPIPEHFRFGLFKNRVERLGDNLDPARPQDIYYLNRFNPGTEDAPRRVDFHLSATFNKPENHYLRKATYQTIKKINHTLDVAHAQIQINLVQAEPKTEEKSSGDLRYNTIVLIEGPLTSGLLGYGPSVSNPRTGEILQAHTNMYSGVLKSTVRNTYQAMVRLSRKRKSAKEQGHPGRDSKALPQEFALESALSQTDRIDIIDKYKNIKAKVKQQTLQQLNPQYIERMKLSRRGIYHASLNRPEQSSRDFQDLMELHSQNNAYHLDMINFQSLGKELMPGIKDIANILVSDETLKPWEQLDKTQRAKVSKIVMVNVYTAILLHELGHNLGLRHNFMASTDADHFYTHEEARKLGMSNSPPYSSIMDYPASSLNELSTFGKYDMAALRYAYAREVELEGSGETRKILTTLTDLQADLAQKNQTIKRYRFCTDENAGLTALCNRFDEGSNLKEIATFYAESYQDRYEERNWRNERIDFTTWQLPLYVSRTMRRFRATRKIYEMFELYSSIFGAEFMNQGCSQMELVLYPQVCTDINNVRDASLIVGNFFLDILKTPDLTCALALPSDQENKTVRLLRLADIYDQMSSQQVDIQHVPMSCFDPEVKNYLASPSNYLRMSFNVKGEAGKYLNSVQDPDPRFNYASDIRVRGIWTDKMLAIRYLASRLDENVTTDKEKGSIIDIPSLRTRIDDFLNHIVTGTPLAFPIKFQAADGREYIENHFELSGENYQIAEGPYLFLARFFGLPDFGKEFLNKALITNAVWFNNTEDPGKFSLAEQFQDSISVFRTRRTTPIHPGEQKELIIDKYKYIAEKENRVALLLVKAKEDFDSLSNVSLPVATQVLAARTTFPEDLDADTSTVLENFTATEIESLIQQFTDLGNNLPPADQFSFPLNSAIKLGAVGLQNALAIIEEMNTPPELATPEVKTAYAVALTSLSGYISGDLQKRVETFEQNIKLLYSP